MKKLLAIILAMMIIPFGVLAETAPDQEAVPVMGKDVVFTRGIELIGRDMVFRVNEQTFEPKTTVSYRLITTDSYDRAQLSFAAVVDGEELISLWVEELEDGRGSATLKNSKYRSTVDSSVHDRIFQLLSFLGYDAYVGRPLPELLKELDEFANNREARQESYKAAEAANPGVLSYEFPEDGSIRIKSSLADGLGVEMTAEIRNFVPEGLLFDLSDLIPDPLDLEKNPCLTRDGLEVLQKEGTNWLLHDPAFMESIAGLQALYSSKNANEQNDERTFQYYLQQAEAGSVYSMYAVGYYYYYGQGTERDVEQAVKWFEKAADAGSSEAVGMLGYVYDVGDGIAADPAKAIEYYQKAVDMNNSYAMYNLAIKYLGGDAVEPDPEKAKELFVRAAKAGNESAINFVKEMYPEELETETEDQ